MAMKTTTDEQEDGTSLSDTWTVVAGITVNAVVDTRVGISPRPGNDFTGGYNNRQRTLIFDNIVRRNLGGVVEIKKTPGRCNRKNERKVYPCSLKDIKILLKGIFPSQMGRFTIFLPPIAVRLFFFTQIRPKSPVLRLLTGVIDAA